MRLTDIIAHLPDMPEEEVEQLFDAVSNEYKSLPYRAEIAAARAKERAETVVKLRESGQLPAPEKLDDDTYQYAVGVVFIPGEIATEDGKAYLLTGDQPTAAKPSDGGPWQALRGDAE